MCKWKSTGLLVMAIVASTDRALAAKCGGPGHGLIVYIAASAEVTADELVPAAKSGGPVAAPFDFAQPCDSDYLLKQRASGDFADYLAANPDSIRAQLERGIVLMYPEGTDIGGVRRQLLDEAEVDGASLDGTGSLALVPNDPLLPAGRVGHQRYQYWSHTLNLPEAWDFAVGHSLVGIIDTGAELAHPDLRVNDGSGNFQGGPLRLHRSRDFFGSDVDVDELDPNDVYAGHGTHVTGMIAGRSNNGQGIAGACWNCSTALGRASGGSTIDASDVVSSLTFLVDQGVQLVNMSFAYPSASCAQPAHGVEAICPVLDYAEEMDVLMVAASGNDRSVVGFPAIEESVIAVGGATVGGQFWSGSGTFGSNFGVQQDLVSPAVDVLSTMYTGYDHHPGIPCGDNFPSGFAPGYGICTGTSMAAPGVTGVGGILRSLNPLLTVADLRDALTSTADSASSWDQYRGYGIPDAEAAVVRLLGQSDGQQLSNRLTPLFSLYSSGAGDRLATTSPQMAAAEILTAPLSYSSEGPEIAGYPEFLGWWCYVGPCPPNDPRAEVFVFTTPTSPTTSPLVPLHRLSYPGQPGVPQPQGNRDSTYTTQAAGVELFESLGYVYEGIEGYVYQKCGDPEVCSPTPSCAPAGTVTLFRMYHPGMDDFAVFPETRLNDFLSMGYGSGGPSLSNCLGYVYPNADADGDWLIDGYEDVLGTDKLSPDSDCDGTTDGEEVGGYPPSDPLDGVLCERD